MPRRTSDRTKKPPTDPLPQTGLSIESAAATHLGLVRRINEDAILERSAVGLWAVADGVGGGIAGDRASGLIVESLARLPAPASYQGFVDAVKARLAEVNRQLLAEAAGLGARGSIASTVVALLFFDRSFCGLWAGDSRLYRLRKGRLERLTRDHSQAEELVERGLVSVEEARHHPLSHIITRAVGSDPALDLDAVEGRIEPDDAFLLCSDGLNRVLSDGEIESILARRSAAEVVRLLIEATLIGGAPDNVSVVAVTIRTPLAGKNSPD